MGVPADRAALAYTLEAMDRLRRQGRPYFLFLNLYDVHAPYCPSAETPLRSFRTLAGWGENLSLPWLLPRVSSHAYLRAGFRMSARGRRILLARYHRAIELMDAKLAEFHATARSAGLLDDTLLVITADHGEAFGEHELYFHDASVYDTHLRGPLWIQHPDIAPAAVDDVVSTRDLFALLVRAGLGEGQRGTLLDPTVPAARPVALAEHFHYAQIASVLPQYAQNIAAAIVGPRKLILRREGRLHYDLSRDPHERVPDDTSLADFAAACRRDGSPAPAIAAAVAHLRRWEPALRAHPTRRHTMSAAANCTRAR